MATTRRAPVEQPMQPSPDHSDPEFQFSKVPSIAPGLYIYLRFGETQNACLLQVRHQHAIQTASLLVIELSVRSPPTLELGFSTLQLHIREPRIELKRHVITRLDHPLHDYPFKLQNHGRTGWVIR